MPEPDPYIGVLVNFVHELRAAGLSVGSGDVLTFCEAMATLDPTELLDLYYGGLATLVNKNDNIKTYTEVFKRYFLGFNSPAAQILKIKAHVAAETEAELAVPATEDPEAEKPDEETMMGLMASDADTLKHKAFTACTPEELAALRRIMKRMKLTPPKRRTRRTVGARSGRRPDMRRTVRESMRMHGEPAEFFWRQRKTRLRPLILILDISGSMADYSRNLLQFAYSAKQAAAKVEVFCFGTRLTRITRAMDQRKPDQALELAAKAVVDWEGGTRIGESLDRFVRIWGRRGLCRGGVVVICSDGLDRGDPSLLASSMERLARLCFKVVWMNPHKGDNVDFKPTTLGMMVAAPHIDVVLSGHDLASLEELAGMLPTLS